MHTKQLAKWLTTTAIAVSLLTTPLILNGQESSGSSGKWRNELGLTYVSGLSDLTDAIEKNYYSADITEWPVGISYRGYFLYKSGFGFGGSVGPIVVIMGDVDSYIVPLGLDARYVVGGGNSSSFILRAGARYPIASGDHMEGSSIGFVGAAAVEFPIASGKMAIGVEAAYDSSEVEVEAGSTNEDIKLGEFSLTVYWRF